MSIKGGGVSMPLKDETKNDPLLQLISRLYFKMGEYLENQREQELIINNLNEQLKNTNESLAEHKQSYSDISKKYQLLNKQFEQSMKTNESLVIKFNEQLEEIKSSIILSKENANRSGRPSLSEEEIQWIRELRAQGLSQRQVAERLGFGNGTIAKYDNNSNSKKSSVFIKTDPLE